MKTSEASIQKVLRAFCHDIGAALRSTEGFSTLLLERGADQLDEKSLYWLSLMKSSGEFGQQLSSALHQYARLFGIEKPKTTVNLSAVAQEVAGNLKTVHPELNITIESLPSIQGHLQLWFTVFDAILLNSIIHGKKENSNSIECLIRSEEDAGQIKIIMEDNGIGIPAEAHVRALQPFSSLGKRKENAGFGLNLCERIAEIHNGTLELGTNPDEGLTVILKLQIN